MLNYWTIAPGEDAIYWDEFLSQSIIGIGWDYLGDISRLNKASIGKQMRAHWHDRSSHKNDVLACIDFAFNLEKGDIIFVKKGLKKMLGYGEVISDYIYDESREHNKSIRKVRWMKTGSWQLIGENRFPLKTLTNVTAYPDYVHKLQGIIEGGVSKLITKYWIFQGNPKIFKMKEYLNSRNVVTWSVNQNKKEIAINDIVFFWMAGPEGSFVAKGKIIEGPSLDIK